MQKYIITLISTFLSFIASADSNTEINSDIPSLLIPEDTSHALLVITFLIIIIALLWVTKYIIRAKQPQISHPLLSMKVIGTLPLSLKDKIIVVEIEDAWLIIGCTQQSLNILYTMGRPCPNHKDTEAFITQAPSSSLPASIEKWFARKMAAPTQKDDLPTHTDISS